jgi:hypothetical protein
MVLTSYSIWEPLWASRYHVSFRSSPLLALHCIILEDPACFPLIRCRYNLDPLGSHTDEMLWHVLERTFMRDTVRLGAVQNESIPNTTAPDACLRGQHLPGFICRSDIPQQSSSLPCSRLFKPATVLCVSSVAAPVHSATLWHLPWHSA